MELLLPTKSKSEKVKLLALFGGTVGDVDDTLNIRITLPKNIVDKIVNKEVTFAQWLDKPIF